MDDKNTEVVKKQLKGEGRKKLANKRAGLMRLKKLFEVARDYQHKPIE